MIRAATALALLAALVAPARAQWVAGGAVEVPLEGDGTSWTVRATVNHIFTGPFLLDTGASVCVLTPTAARTLRLQPTGREVDLVTANGVVRAPVVRVGTFDVGRHRARDVEAVVHPAVREPLAGIIGLSYLNKFHYSIDAKRRVLRFR